MFNLSRCLGCLCLFVFSLSALAAEPAVPGIHNFHQIDNHVYRGGQPNDAGLQYLAKIGVKTVVDLREPGARADHERETVSALAMKYVSVPMTGLTPPTDSQIDQILGLLEDKTSGPVFVHCKRGADRTGAVIGAYRVDYDHWGNAEALKEAKADGIAFFQMPRKNYIMTFQPRTAVATAKASANPTATAAPAVLLPAVAH